MLLRRGWKLLLVDAKKPPLLLSSWWSLYCRQRWYNDEVTMTRYGVCGSEDMAAMRWWNGDCGSEDMATSMVTMTMKTQWYGDNDAAQSLQQRGHDGNCTATAVVMMHQHGDNNTTMVKMRTWQQWYDKVRQKGDNSNDDAMARRHGMATAAAKGTETDKEDAMVTVWRWQCDVKVMASTMKKDVAAVGDDGNSSGRRQWQCVDNK